MMKAPENSGAFSFYGIIVAMDTNNRTPLGTTSAPSTTQDVKIIIKKTDGLEQLKNKMVYFDVETADGKVNRALGFVTEITTVNTMVSDPNMQSVISISDLSSEKQDMRSIDIKVASVFNYDKEDESWTGNKPLPTSPSTGTRVYDADRESIKELFDNLDPTQLSYLGHIRGTDNIPAPLVMPDFGGSRGASSTAVVGKTGSGKTVFTSQMFATMMKYEDHAIIAVDPQGQWNNENGLTFSLKRFAEGLGRKVYSLRVSEDIQLELNEDNFVGILTQLDLWAKLGRMGKENRDLLSVEVAESIINNVQRSRLNKETNFQGLLSEVLSNIVENPSTVARIYASEDRQKNFKQSIYALIDPAKAVIFAYANSNERKLEKALEAEGQDANEDTIWERATQACIDNGTIVENPKYSKDPDATQPAYTVSATELSAVETRWQGILAKFTPLINLFQSKNLNGGVRRPLSGPNGFLEEILKVRDKRIDPPAPYVILDMSPDTKTKAKADFMKGNNNELNMRRLLDNDSIKGTILSMVFSSIKEASEEAFSNGGGNLNTQIAFDEAWRYAPDHSENEVIMALSKTLEGFALDTRKFGIGWTYILQSPSDLRHGIWKQLKFVYSGYGLVGADLNKLGDLMDDSANQLKIYKQFVAPDLTREYPFMITGSVSPLITAQIPLFVNAYNDVAEFLDDNRQWIESIVTRRGLSMMTVESILPYGAAAPKRHIAADAPSYVIGRQVKEENRVVSNFKAEEKSQRVSTKLSADPILSPDSVMPPF